MMKNEYVTCAVCGKKFKGRIPKSGDGSARFPSIHWRYAKVHWHIADNTYEKQPVCDGSYRECKEDQLAEQDLKGE